MTGPRRVRRARSVLVTWRERKLVLLNYQTQISVSADPEAVRFLHLLDDWTRLQDFYALLPEYTPKSIREAVRELARNSFLVSEGTPLAKRDADLASVWSDWLPHAGFHFATKDFNYTQPPVSFFKRYLAESPQPAFLKSYGKVPRIQLPRERAPDGEFERVLLARKTHRDFSRKHVPLKTIATLLHHTWGLLGGSMRRHSAAYSTRPALRRGRAIPAKFTCLPCASADWRKVYTITTACITGWSGSAPREL